MLARALPSWIPGQIQGERFMLSAKTWLWSITGIVYAFFVIWYTDFGGPLTPEEIAYYEQRLVQSGASAEERERIGRFMREDDGSQFIMVNLLDLSDAPPTLAATGADAPASALLAHYMEHMYPALLSRASHPVFAGAAVFSLLDVAGIQGADHWDQAALMRYRSRRDLMAIASDPAFNGRHEYKLAALTKTLAFPVNTTLYFHDLRVMMMLIGLSLAALIDLLFLRPRGQDY
tara:strand:+ start:5828 stop:6526 length:699 start_codon:yes stop_codon:yes gene_type:complete